MSENANRLNWATVQALQASALTASVYLIAALDEPQQEAIIEAVKGGASLVLEFGPLPGINNLKIVLVEREGARQAVCSLAL